MQMPHDAVEIERMGQGLQERLAVAFGNHGLHLGENAQQGSAQADQGFVLLGAEVVGVVADAVDDDLPPGPGAVLGRQPAHLARLVAPTVADLDAHRDGVLLFGMIGAFSQVQRLIDGAVAVDHEVRGKPATAARANPVVHRLEAGTRVHAAVEVQNQLRHHPLQIRQAPVGESRAGSVARPVRITTAAALLDASLVVAIEALLVVPQHHRASQVDRLASHHDGGATARPRPAGLPGEEQAEKSGDMAMAWVQNRGLTAPGSKPIIAGCACSTS